MRGTSCRLHGPDLKVRAGANARYPDALIDCGARTPGSTLAQSPVAVFEVLSKGTAGIDQTLKLRDYEATASMRFYVLISQDEPRAVIYQRDDIGMLGLQSATLLDRLDAVVELPGLQVSLPLSNLYDSIEFEPG